MDQGSCCSLAWLATYQPSNKNRGKATWVLSNPRTSCTPSLQRGVMVTPAQPYHSCGRSRGRLQTGKGAPWHKEGSAVQMLVHGLFTWILSPGYPQLGTNCLNYVGNEKMLPTISWAMNFWFAPHATKLRAGLYPALGLNLYCSCERFFWTMTLNNNVWHFL